MKQTTKVLLPLGLFMSVVIPITVKTLFTDTDFFDSNENSKVDYLQPYKAKPETLTDLPQLTVGQYGDLEVVEPASQGGATRTEQHTSSETSSRERKLDLPSSLTPSNVEIPEESDGPSTIDTHF